MGEPSSHLSDLEQQVKHQFPASTIAPLPNGGYMVYTLHGSGATQQEALQNCLATFTKMAARGRGLRTMLDDILADLKTPGMNRERHDEFQESLSICEACLNDGILTQSVPWIQVPSFTREINDLRRRVSARLGVAAQNAKDFNDSKAHAAVHMKPFGHVPTFEELVRLTPLP